ncbi:hypothetical protein T07_440 [Trichinella nelsoni]|uniref:Transmembrane protein n=1 Tax=Trichinella nelsoni TaxID=6336 RepID=A0A0V0RT05_9BILA|nr:hypothetical protein T07_440 [Trichinella nelsoni]
MNSKHRIRFTSYSKHCSFLGLILIFVAALTPSWEVLIHSNSVDKIRDRGLFYAYWFNQPPGDVALPRMVNYPAFEFLLIDDRPMNAHAPAYDNISYTTALLLMIGFVLASLKLATPVSPYNLGLIALHFILSLLATLFTSGAVAFYYFMIPEIPSAYSLDKCVTTRYGYSFFTCAFGTLLLIIAMIFQTAQIIYVIFHPEKWTIPTVYIATLRTPVRENKQIPFTRT